MLYKTHSTIIGKACYVGKIWSLKLAFSIERQEMKSNLDIPKFTEKMQRYKYEENANGQ